MRFLSVMFAAAVLLAMGGCGSGEDDAAAAEAAASAKAEKARLAALEKNAAVEREEFAACTSSTGGLSGALDELNSRIQVGLTFSDYNTELGDVMVVYNRTDFGKVAEQPGCLTDVGLPLENAFEHYRKAGTIWQDCIDEFDCSIEDDAVNAKLQNHWSKASDLLGQASSALEDHAATETS